MKINKLIFICIAILLINTNVFGADRPNFAVQEPKSNSMELTYFVPGLIKFPFEIKYPGAWYIREEVAGNIPCLFFTREPIRKEGDRYNVGASLLYNIGYFASKEPSDSILGQMAQTVIKMRDWDESKKQFVESLEKNGNSIISQADVTISGQPSLRVEYESKTARITTIYIKAGNHLLTIIFEAPPQEYEQYKDIFEKMLNSFFFTR